MLEGTVHEFGMRKYCLKVGGVLEHAGYGGVLTNMARLHDQANREEEDFNTLIVLWHRTYGTRKVTATEVAKLMKDNDLYPDGLQNHQPAAVGRKVKYWEGRTAHGFVVRRPYDPANHRHTLQLQALTGSFVSPGATGEPGDTGGELEASGEIQGESPPVATGEFAPAAPGWL